MFDLTTSSDAKRRLFVSLLVVFIASVAGMGVVWVQSLPKITMEGSKAVVSNCELPLPTYAIGVCPKLYCKKNIIESGIFPLHSQIGFNKPKPSADQLLAGAVRYREKGGTDITIKHFECELEGYVVSGMKYL